MENKTLIEKAIGFIQQNPKENLSLQSIADHAGFSLTYFDAVFQKHTGYTPVEYARIYKLTRSALELRRTEKTVLDIALDFGYASPESFTRAFKGFYSLTPSQYREKYAQEAITWQALSGKIAISHFGRNFPQLRESSLDAALDFCFTHNPRKYAEDIVGMTVAETKIFTIGDFEALEHFVYVSDYDQPTPSVTLVCDSEAAAIDYVRILAEQPNPRFTIRKSVDAVWEAFDAAVAQLGLVCRYGYDLLYTGATSEVPEFAGLTTRELTAQDMTALKVFQKNGGCWECHVNAIGICLEGKGNLGLRAMGVFAADGMVCLAMPTLDEVRELRKYDIGAIFAREHTHREQAIELAWKAAIAMAQADHAVIGNAYATEDDGPLGVAYCEKIGLEKVAQSCSYSK